MDKIKRTQMLLESHRQQSDSERSFRDSEKDASICHDDTVQWTATHELEINRNQIDSINKLLQAVP